MLNDSHIRAIASGDHNAFRLLFTEWEQRLLFYAYSLTRDIEASQDVVQDALVLLWDKRRSFDSILAAKSFIYTTIKHKIWRQARNDANRKRILGQVGEEFDEQCDDTMMAAEICGQVRTIISQLPPQSRRIIEFSMQGMTVEQIAQTLDVSPNTVKTLKKTAYKSMRANLTHLKGFVTFLLLS